MDVKGDYDPRDAGGFIKVSSLRLVLIKLYNRVAYELLTNSLL